MQSVSASPANMHKPHITLLKGIPASGKTSTLVQHLVNRHKQKGALSYQFIGASGGFLRGVREQVLLSIPSIFNDSFQVIDQFVVKAARSLHPDRLHVTSDFVASLAADVLSDNSALGELSRRGRGILDGFVWFYTWLKEKKDPGLLVEIQNSEDALLKEYAGWYEKFESTMQRLHLFSTVDAFSLVLQAMEKGDYPSATMPDGELSGKVLYVDGFFDLNQLLLSFLPPFLSQFEAAWICFPLTPDAQPLDPSFEQLQQALEALFPGSVTEVFREETSNKRGELQLWMDHYQCPGSDFDEGLSGDCIQLAKAKNPGQECQLAAGVVKQFLGQPGNSPDDVAFVVRDLKKYGDLLTPQLEEMGIPYRFEGHLPLSKSLNVSKLVLPFRAFASGYDPTWLAAMIESGYVEQGPERIVEFEQVAGGARLMNSKMFDGSRESLPSSLRARRAEWQSKMQRYQAFLQRKLDAARSSEDYADIEEPVLEMLRSLQAVWDVCAELFDVLENWQRDHRKRPPGVFEQLFQDSLALLRSRECLSEEEAEQNATAEFFERLLPSVRQIVAISGGGSVTPLEYWNILRILLNQASFPSSLLVDNRVLILDLLNARYRFRRLKVFLGMSDQYYPSIPSNPLVWRSLPDGIDWREKFVQRDDRDFVAAMRNGTETAWLFAPEADFSGHPYAPSSAFKRFALFREIVEQDPSHAVCVATDFPAPSAYSLKAFAHEMLRPGVELSEALQSNLMQLGIPLLSIQEKARAQLRKEERAFQVNPELPGSPLDLEGVFGSTLSASRYGVLDKCPRKFFLQYLLKIPRKQDLLSGFDPMEEGMIFHAVLKKFFEGLSANGMLLENLDEEGFRKITGKSLSDGSLHPGSQLEDIIRGELRAHMFHPSRLLFETEVLYFHGYLADFLGRYRDGSKISPAFAKKSEWEGTPFFPSLFEISVDRSQNVRIHQNPDIFFVGKIDRVDRSPAGWEFIVDYKRSTSGAEKENIHQLLFYAHARNVLAGKKTVAGMVFFPILPGSKPSRNVAKVLTTYEMDNDQFVVDGARKEKEWKLEDFLDSVGERLERVLSGHFDFPEKGSPCFSCEFKGIFCPGVDR
ncbi:MAG TPA: PD-(D/E)XK nuclease family protein [Thermotogota bacterium]|nr:PD-(D/E)XK nuclease family protein [Thermotogota bacterium]